MRRGPCLTAVAVPLTQAPWSSSLFGVASARPYCNVRPSKSLCAPDDLPSAPVLTARSLASPRRSQSEQPARVSWLAHRPPVGDGMIRSVKLWPALGAGPWSLRWPGARRGRHGQEEIKHVGSQTVGVLLARELVFGPARLATSVAGCRGWGAGFAGKCAMAARLPAASRSYSGAGRKFRRGEISAAQPNLEELLGRPRRTEWHPSAWGEC